MEKKFISRCSQCAYVNPDEAVVCGMCGTRLAGTYREYKKRKEKGWNYEKSIVRGNLDKAVTYGTAVWERELFRVVSLMIAVSVLGFILAGLNDAFAITPAAQIIWVLIDFYFFSVIVAGSHRGFIDVIRERRLEPGRVIASGFADSLKVMAVLIPALVFIAMLSILIYLWAQMLGMVDTSEGSITSTISSIFSFLMVVFLFVIIVFPGFVWLTEYISLAVCRVIDRRAMPHTAFLWAISKIARHHWSFMGQVFAQLLMQAIGLAICFVGLFGTIPQMGIQNVAMYEWIRLHGPDADEY